MAEAKLANPVEDEVTEHKMMTVPIPVLLAFPDTDTPGNAVKWRKGEEAWFLSCDGSKNPVTCITGEFVGHEAVPGELCLDVVFDGQGGKVGCVLAKQLRLRWPR